MTVEGRPISLSSSDDRGGCPEEGNNVVAGHDQVLRQVVSRRIFSILGVLLAGSVWLGPRASGMDFFSARTLASALVRKDSLPKNQENQSILEKVSNVEIALDAFEAKWGVPLFSDFRELLKARFFRTLVMRLIQERQEPMPRGEISKVAQQSLEETTISFSQVPTDIASADTVAYKESALSLVRRAIDEYPGILLRPISIVVDYSLTTDYPLMWTDGETKIHVPPRKDTYSDKEYLAFIHELNHFIDIHFLSSNDAVYMLYYLGSSQVLQYIMSYVDAISTFLEEWSKDNWSYSNIKMGVRLTSHWEAGFEQSSEKLLRELDSKLNEVWSILDEYGLLENGTITEGMFRGLSKKPNKIEGLQIKANCCAHLYCRAIISTFKQDRTLHQTILTDPRLNFLLSGTNQEGVREGYNEGVVSRVAHLFVEPIGRVSHASNAVSQTFSVLAEGLDEQRKKMFLAQSPAQIVLK